MVRQKSIPNRSISSPANGEKNLLTPSMSFWSFYSVPSSSSSPSSSPSPTSSVDRGPKGERKLQRSQEGKKGNPHSSDHHTSNANYYFNGSTKSKVKRGEHRGNGTKHEYGKGSMEIDEADNEEHEGSLPAGASKRERAKLQRRLTMEELEMEKKEAMKSHPLASKEDVPAFSDLQCKSFRCSKLMTWADTIYQCVSLKQLFRLGRANQ